MTNPSTGSASRGRAIAYWAATVALIAFMTVGGVSNILWLDYIRVIMEQQMGYPAFFATILGVWKLAGALTLAVPGLPRLKEWAYAGAIFLYSGAAVSHLAVRDLPGALLPLMIAAIAITSWALRPASRRLTDAGSRPASFNPSSVPSAS